ncbi:hypothetical protein AX16_000685 [Volvariella volvacea WC 439]|nr:hypothetical protein AX16_000685 [Volvariella volvacea WC 439]
MIWRFIASLTSVIVDDHSVITRAEDYLTCRPPTRIFQKWTPNTFLPGPDGYPMPVTYTLEHPRPHRLSIIDLDARDMQMAINVDGVPSGITSDFVLDKYVTCGDNISRCVNYNFSGGVVVVPPGRHTVEITWVGKEYIPGTHEMDWGGDYSRRFGWQLEYCS